MSFSPRSESSSSASSRGVNVREKPLFTCIFTRARSRESNRHNTASTAQPDPQRSEQNGRLIMNVDVQVLLLLLLLLLLLQHSSKQQL
jgi:hypothetical protein